MSEAKQKRQRGYTRLSSKRQITIPVAALGETGLAPGDVLKVEVDEHGRIVLTPAPTRGERRRAALAGGAGAFTGLYPPGYLEGLRDEWL